MNRQELQKKIVAERVARSEAETRVEELVAEKKRLETTIRAHKIMHNAFVMNYYITNVPVRTVVMGKNT